MSRFAEPLRAMFVCAEYPPGPSGGIGVFYRDLARALAERGARPFVVVGDPAADGEARERDGAVEVRRIGLRAASGPRWRLGARGVDAGPIRRARALSAAARSVAAEFRPHVVESHEWAAPLWTAPARPFVVRLHGGAAALAEARGRAVPRLARMLERRLARQADAVVAASDWIAGQTARVLGIERSSVRVEPSGIDLDRFRPVAGVERDPREILYVGSLREDKGLPELLNALESVLQRRPWARAALAGGPVSSASAAPERVRLLGPVPRADLPALYSRAGVCVFPSRAEAFGLACLEAMACGAAVVASRAGGLAEVVGAAGLLVEPRDPAALAEALGRLLDRPAEARALGERARRRALGFDLGGVADRALEHYRTLVEGRPAWRARIA